MNLNQFILFEDLTTPSIRHTGKSITFITDQVNQTILCTSYSYPAPVFTWSVLYNNGQVRLKLFLL